MEIHNSIIHGAQGISAPHRLASSKPTAPAKELPQSDSFTLSEAGRASRSESSGSLESSTSGVRFELVNRVKREIAAGTYDTPDKMDIAIDRLLGRTLGARRQA